MGQAITDVIFRMGKGESEPYALFPGEAGTMNPATCTCYQRIGQHSSADYSGCISESRPATPVEYAPLKRELERLGYTLWVIKRANRRHYLNRTNQIKQIWSAELC